MHNLGNKCVPQLYLGPIWIFWPVCTTMPTKNIARPGNDILLLLFCLIGMITSIQSVQDRARYDNKLRLFGLKECPFRLAASCWRNDPLLWTSLTYPDIFNYLISLPGKRFLACQIIISISLDAFQLK